MDGGHLAPARLLEFAAFGAISIRYTSPRMHRCSQGGEEEEEEGGKKRKKKGIHHELRPRLINGARVYRRRKQMAGVRRRERGSL